MNHFIDYANSNDLKALLSDAVDRNAITFLNEELLTPAPINERPEKILCVGLNYADHAKEAGATDLPEEPILFSKFNNSLAAHQEDIPYDNIGEKLDYEAELVIVIGKEAKQVSEEEAEDYIFGYSTGNDISLRDLQFLSGQWLIGKTLDKFAPIGPYLVTKDEIDDINDLDISLKRNGELMQSSNTKHMIFNCANIVSYISQIMTLKPGDMIFTGTPEGVVIGYPEAQQNWLKPGDQMEVTIESIGTLMNTIV